MELIPVDVCMLCEESTAVLTAKSVTPYVKYVNKTFFDKNNKALKKFQKTTQDGSLCVLCSHKIVVSHKFKDGYEELCKKRTAFKKTRAACFLCETKTADLIQTDDNPNDITTKIKSFMDSTLFPRPYIQCVICFDCVFYLSIWFEMNFQVMKKVSSDEGISKSLQKKSSIQNKALKKIQPRGLNHTPNTKNENTIIKKDKENITPPGSSTRSSNKRSISETSSAMEGSSLKRRHTSRVISESDDEGSSIDFVDNNSVNKKKKILNKKTRKYLFLKSTLKHLKSIRDINSSTTWPESILKDKKMFADIPYVVMVKDSNQILEKTANYVCKPLSKKNAKLIKKSLKNNNNGKKIIEIHDEPQVRTSRTAIKGKSGRFLRNNKQLPANNDESPDGQRRSGRLNKPMEVIELLDSEEETNKQKNNLTIFNKNEKNNKKTVVRQKAGKEIKISNKFSLAPDSESTYTCNICDQAFSVFCDYKAHDLWHKKPENVVVNVTRSNLPTQIKVSQFKADLSHKKIKNQNTDTNKKIDKIMQKYVNFSGADAFEDADFNSSKEIESIIENLNSPENEDESKENDAPEKCSEIRVINQDKHENSENEKDAVEQQDSEIEAASSVTAETDDTKTVKEKNSISDKIITGNTKDSGNSSKKLKDSDIDDSENDSFPEDNSENTEQEKSLEEDQVLKKTETADNNVQPEKNDDNVQSEQEDDNTQSDEEESDVQSKQKDDNVQPEQEDGDVLQEQDDDNAQPEEEDDADHDQEKSESKNTSPSKQIENNKEGEVEVETSVEEADDECLIEKRLAVIHAVDEPEPDNAEFGHNSSNKEQQVEDHEEQRLDSDEELNGDSKDENTKAANGTTDKNYELEEISDNFSETDQDEKEENSSKAVSKTDNMKEDDEMSDKNISKKRKTRGSDDSSENSSDAEISSPKAKKVRFAMDYQPPRSDEDDAVPELILHDSDIEDSDVENAKDAVDIEENNADE